MKLIRYPLLALLPWLVMQPLVASADTAAGIDAAVNEALAAFGDFSGVTSQPGAMCIAAADDLSTPPSVMSAIVDAMSGYARGPNPLLKTLPKGGHLFPLTMAPAVARLLEAHWAAVESTALPKARGGA